MTPHPDTNPNRVLAIRGPRTPEERSKLEAYLRSRPDIEAEWFDSRDDEDLHAALCAGEYAACVFAGLDAAIDAAVGGHFAFDRIDPGKVALHLAIDAPASISAESLRRMLEVTSQVSRARLRSRDRKQTIAGAILSFALLASITALLIIGL